MFPSNGINALNGVKISKNRIVWKRERERGVERNRERGFKLIWGNTIWLIFEQSCFPVATQVNV